AVTLAAHLAACRENWLDRMIAGGKTQVDWWPKKVELGSLAGRYAKMEAKWTDYLAGLGEDGLDVDFEFPLSGGGGYRWSIEGQIVQLVGHAFYHRGQISLLVSQLGGETEDTDYLFWAFGRQPERWKKLG
ncbi:MAG: DinB family protein, partial [Fimbriimonas ginsengisoli]|nr:DinB family protein [Fimbriimonas ginsengisoli]